MITVHIGFLIFVGAVLVFFSYSAGVEDGKNKANHRWEEDSSEKK
jgi:hypothetical protein